MQKPGCCISPLLNLSRRRRCYAEPCGDPAVTRLTHQSDRERKCQPAEAASFVSRVAAWSPRDNPARRQIAWNCFSPTLPMNRSRNKGKHPAFVFVSEKAAHVAC
ncbi:hypothetical protein ROHU_022501 [Labeo rohita]|uniref:Uncharacterized protein n=1 Tax=Labeo rohita TaxID=84645 RepID=A0A498MVI1_LABRO|nr:hypothetical protein ROHU_022501 [Labeo rohita]